MIKEVDEDDDGAICFREFLLIFRKLGWLSTTLPIMTFDEK